MRAASYGAKWDSSRSAAVAANTHLECDVSGTYVDEWQGTSINIEQFGKTLKVSGADGTWGPDEGTVEGRDLNIWSWRLEGTFEHGLITWKNGCTWKRQSPAPGEQAAVDTTKSTSVGAAETEDPCQDAATAVDISGTYSDPWQRGARTRFIQNGTRLLAEGPDGSWGPEEGRALGADIQIFNQKARFENSRIVWENGNIWEPVKDEAAPESRTPAEATTAGVANDVSGTAEAAEESGRWDDGGVWSRASAAGSTSKGAAQDGDAQWASNDTCAAGNAENAAAKASWGIDGAAAAATSELVSDAQKKAARWRDFETFQSWYKGQNVLPGLTLDEVQANEERLFSPVGDGRAGVDFDLYDRVSCSISGPKSENIPQLTTFEALYEEFADFLPTELVENIRRCGYVRPTPVQKFSIPAGLAGRDIMCCAQTGSGKTAAFLVPILASMIRHGKATGALEVPYEGPCRPDTIVLSPTRELCLQIYDEALKFTHKTPHRTVRVYGQEPVKVQLESLAKGGDLCIATPGRLWDFVDSGVVQVTDVQCLVLDEADRMLSMNMEQFIRQVVEKYSMPPKEERQTLMFSATFPEDCQKLASEYLYEHVFIGVGVVGGAVNTIVQELIKVAPEEKFDRLIEFLDEWLNSREASERMLVFTNSKVQAKGLDEKLYERNIDTGALHGDLTQPEREVNLNRFRCGDIDVLVATDLASRGLDICGVSQVLNYDLPWSPDVYVQRIGRTGRIGHRGKATSFVAVSKEDGSFLDDDSVLKVLPGIMQDDQTGCNNEVPQWLLEHNTKTMQSQWSQEPRAKWQSSDQTDVRRWDQEPWAKWQSSDQTDVR